MPPGGTGQTPRRDAAARESNGARHAALLLHSMDPADRAWVLNQLPEVERAEVRWLLAELENLGIERDPSLIAQALGAGDLDGDESDSPPSGEHAALFERTSADDEKTLGALHALDEAGVDAMIRLMRGEPASLVAEWLLLSPWPWRERLLDGLEPSPGRRVQAILASTTAHVAAPATRHALIAAVGTALESRTPTKASRPLHQTWRQSFLRSFLRVWRGVRSRRRVA